MSKTQCFKIKPGTEFEKEVKSHFEGVEKWREVIPKVSNLIGEELTEIVMDPENLGVTLDEIKDEETKRLFRNDGYLKKNIKKANVVRKDYLDIIRKSGLSDFKNLSYISFVYGVMTLQGQSLERFRTHDNTIYYKANFDLEESSNGNVIPISEVEYHERYIKEIKLAGKE